MAALNGFPLVSQRTTVTGDGRPSENALYDCVAACVDAMCRYWLHTPENSIFNPDHFKDVAYGENWKNDGTDAARYVDYCKTLGINLYSVKATSAMEAITLAHEYIEKGIPATFTELDPYVDTNLAQYAGWTHACCWFADDNNGLTALDPFIGKALYKTNGAWASVLRSNQLWIAEKEASMSGIPQGWRDDGTTLVSPSSVQGGPDVHITGLIRDYVLAHNWDYRNVAMSPAEHKDQLELSNSSLGPGWQQTFRWSMLGVPDSGPLAGKVIWEWLGQELEYLRGLYAQAQAEIAQLKAQPAMLDAGKVKDRLSTIGLASSNGNATIQQLVTQAIS
jgi:hypothetical protein